MRRYLVIVERYETGFTAYTPDLPGCVGAGPTIEAAEEAVHAALRLHIEGMEKDGEPIPQTASVAEYLLL